MKKLLIYGCLLAAVFVGVYLVPAMRTTDTSADVLPAKLEVVGVADSGNDASMLDQLGFTFRLESCGAVVFSLSSVTVERLKSGGLTFLSDALEARGFHNQSYYRYEGWRGMAWDAGATELVWRRWPDCGFSALCGYRQGPLAADSRR